MQTDRTFVLKRALIEAPRWLLLATLVFAPWAYGCTRPWAIDVLNRCMLLVTLLWLAGCAARKVRPATPRILWVSAIFLFLQGWWLNLNAMSYYDTEEFRFVPVPNLLSFAPGSIDLMQSVPLMIRITGLLGIVCFVAELSTREVWRRRIWLTVGVTGGMLILYGLIQRMLGAPMIFWELGRTGENFFATYYYHGNAAAFINLVLPLIAGLTLLAFRGKASNSARAFWIPVSLISIAGAVAAASKAGMLITLGMMAVFAIWRGKFLKEAWSRVDSVGVRVMTVIGLGGVLVVLGWFGWTRMIQRWSPEVWMTGSAGTRLLTYQTCLAMLADSGWWGFGPGNFSIAFPHYTAALGSKIEGFWRFAHQDYLQTLIEWGLVGGAVWSILFLGGLVAGVRCYRKQAKLLSTADRTLLFTTLLALFGVAMHAFVDFPLQIASLQFYTAVYLGLAWGATTWKSDRPA